MTINNMMKKAFKNCKTFGDVKEIAKKHNFTYTISCGNLKYFESSVFGMDVTMIVEYNHNTNKVVDVSVMDIFDDEMIF